ncbi:hypothetical protein D3C81_1919290 [compost metagenome]
MALAHDHRANPGIADIQLALLFDQFDVAEGWRELFQQLRFELGDRQEQGFGWGDLGVLDVAQALCMNLRQDPASA